MLCWQIMWSRLVNRGCKVKGKYSILVLNIVVSAMCLTSCIPSKTALKEQEKNNSSSIEIGDLSNKHESPASKTKVDINESKPKLDTVSTAKELHPLEVSASDKDFADLTKRLQNSKLNGFAESLVLCTVDGDPITLGDYRRQFKNEQEQMEAALAANPQAGSNLVRMAQEQGVSLSLQEKQHLVNSASKMQAGGAKGFNQMLAENKLTKSQFQDQVFDVGLAFKMAGILIEQGLLNELISRKLLSATAKADGYSKEALNRYTEISKSPQYKRLLQVSGISADDLREEIVTNELCLREIDKIKKESPISDIEISNYYEKNRGKFRHDARIRLSQIVIPRNSKVSQTLFAEKFKLRKANPKLSEAELNKQIADSDKKQEQLANELLQRARNGEDFAALANQYSENKTGQKNGGDIGFQEVSRLEKSFADKIDKLPVGGITPEVIANPDAFYIFKVSAKESKGFYNLSEIKDNLKKLLEQEKGRQVVMDWLANARHKATISISPELKNLMASNKLQKRVQ
jgi:hypothetical protein